MNTRRVRLSTRPRPDSRCRLLSLRKLWRLRYRSPTFQEFVAVCTGLSVFLLNLAVLYRVFVNQFQHGKAQWYIGTSKIDITPTETVWLSGFAHRNRTADSTEPLSPLFIRAVAIRHVTKPQVAYVVISADVIGLDRELADRIYRAAHREFRLPRERLRICVTHTHSGPAIGNNLAPLIPDDNLEKEKIRRYADFFYDSVLQAIRKSLANKVVAVGHFGRGTAEIAVNRRQILEKDFNGVNRGTTDDSLPVLWFTAGKSTIAGMFGYAAHATVITTSYRYTGDFVGLATLRLEREGGIWLFLAGCGGDQNVYPRGTVELATHHAASLSKAVQAVVRRGGQQSISKVAAKHTYVRLPFEKQYKAEELQRRTRTRDKVTKRAAQLLLNKLTPDGLTPRDYTYGIAVWHMDENAVAFLGGEPTVGYCTALSHIGISWVVGYCEEVMGYIGTREVIKSGGREGGERAAWYYGLPAAWNETVEAIVVEGVKSNLKLS